MKISCFKCSHRNSCDRPEISGRLGCEYGEPLEEYKEYYRVRQECEERVRSGEYVPCTKCIKIDTCRKTINYNMIGCANGEAADGTKSVVKPTTPKIDVQSKESQTEEKREQPVEEKKEQPKEEVKPAETKVEPIKEEQRPEPKPVEQPKQEEKKPVELPKISTKDDDDPMTMEEALEQIATISNRHWMVFEPKQEAALKMAVKHMTKELNCVQKKAEIRNLVIQLADLITDD